MEVLLMSTRCRLGLHDVQWFADSEGSWNWCWRCGLQIRQDESPWPFLTRLKRKIQATAQIWLGR